MKYLYRVNLEEHFSHTLASESNSSFTTMINNSISSTNEVSDTMLGWSISRQICIIVFAVLTFSMILATLIRSATFVSVCMKASMNLHNAMFNAITRATMYFFNTNSSGKNQLK